MFSSPLYALASTGEPFYPPQFEHFNYANPDAPIGGILKLGQTGTFDSLNPFIVRGQPPYGLPTGPMSLVFESMMTRCWDEPFALYAHLAESAEVALDRSAVIFNLNETAHFSDGVPFTAEDVVFSYETLLKKGRPNHRSYYKKVEKVEILSPHRVKFKFQKDEGGVYDREMPLIIAMMPILPKHDWENRKFDQTTLRIPVGSGPYKIIKVDAGHRIVYQRDPLYWAWGRPAVRGLYNFEKIQVDYYRDDSVSLQAFKAGQYDYRREADPTKWVTGYIFPAASHEQVLLEKAEHGRTEPAYGYIFNTRRPLFADVALRQALGYTFDFGWVNKNLFHGQYKQVDSFFPNSELAAHDLPEGRELEILELYRDQLSPDIFSKTIRALLPSNQKSFRANLLLAEALLRSAGYKIKDDRLYAPSGVPVTFEILLSDPSEEKAALNWVACLERLGIVAHVHTVDSAQYQSRLASFDFDVTANKWLNSLSPGNEQTYFFGSAAADRMGSRNYAGIKDSVVDILAASVSKAPTREEQIATVRALDRVLMHGHYFIPLYYLGSDNMAFWTHIQHPEKASLYGNVLESWWANKSPE